MSVLRDVEPSDVDAFFEHQSDPEAAAMAVFPARDREAFSAHWRRLLADDSAVKRTIVDGGAVAGNIGCWEQDGRRLVGYWVVASSGAAGSRPRRSRSWRPRSRSGRSTRGL